MLRLGTAGIPLSGKGSGTVNGIAKVKEIGLDAMELEFVHSVNISEEKAPEVAKAAKENDVALTCHGSYFINLNAVENAKLEASKKRIISAAHITNLCGGKSVTFHPGFYMKSTKEEAYKKVRQNLKEVVQKLRDFGNNISIRPETTGKHSQFGNLDEILKLCQEIDGVLPCIDYAHMRARENTNSTEAFNNILEKVETSLGTKALKNMHIQFAGVNFSSKGELNHLTLKESDMNYEAIIESWKQFNIEGVAISESPNVEDDALLMKKLLQ